MAGFLAAQFPGDYYGSDFAKSMDFLGYLANQRQREEAFKNQQINRDMALEDLFQTQQMNPLKRREQELINRTREVQIPGLAAVSKKQVNEWEELEQTSPARIKAKLSEYYRSADENDVRQEVAALQKALMNPNLPPSARKQLELVLEYTPEHYKLNKVLQNKIAVKETPTPKVGGGTGSVAKPPPPPKKLEELQTHFLRLALEATDPAQKQFYLDRAAAVKQERDLIEQARAEAKLTGKPDVGTIANVPTHKGVTASAVPVPAQTPQPQKTAPPASLAEVQKMYPGVPADKLKEAYKRKFGVDLK